MIEHGDGRCDCCRMRVWHVDGAGSKLDLLGCGCEPGNESDAGGDVLGLVGDVLADIRLGEPELIREQKSLTILPERLPPILVEKMDRHRKKTELHDPPPRDLNFGWQGTCVLPEAKTSPAAQIITR
ncbi:hypothetical protein M2181_008322 [Bradyrhizobium elkanii]|nr:hypothetical protein [Bradyrhizobium elkanii]MCS3524412.1 hypothetical protein [Bradyrhizobium elkanii]MCS4072068.1 hypothetical protein [Bradyrhizobium elkanii]MCS4078701.1 hypothetical protein [Bradyrhizobium elkanii]